MILKPVLLSHLFLKQPLSRNILKPLPAAVTFDDPGPFDKLVGAQEEIYHQYRQFKDESGDKSQRNRITPHVYGVADQSETAVTAGPEYAGNQGRIDGSTHNIVGVDKKHILQIVHGRVAEVSKIQDKGRHSKHQCTAYGAGDNGEFHQFGGVISGVFHVACAHHIA